MNLQKLRQLLKSDEGFKLDFKLRLNIDKDEDKKEFVKDVIAIANTPGGRGYILFGIEDKTRRIVGLEKLHANTEERIQQIIANRSTPPVPVCFEVMEISHRKIGVLTIFRSMQVPHQMIQTGAFYVRRGSTTDKASRHEIANMLQQYGMLSFENVPCRHSQLTDLDEVLIEQYIGQSKLDSMQQDMILQSIGVIASDWDKEVYYPTYGGLLLMGKRPQDFIPQAILEMRFNGKSYGFEGNIKAMLDHFEAEIKNILPPSYPKEGLLEVVINAMIHRSYWNNGQYVQVIVGKDKIVVSNPMGHEIYGQKNTRWRVNPWLYSRLLIMHQLDSFHLGIGLEETELLFKDKGGIQVRTDQLEGIFEVTLPGISAYEV